MLNIVLLAVGFVALIFGANILVDSASSLARKLNVPNIVIGLTIVAFGTSAPELVVNLFASIEQNPDIALGNVVGSNIFNVFAILGIAAIITPLAVKNNTTWIEIPLSLLSALVVLVLANDVLLDKASSGMILRSEGIVLLAFFLIFLVYNIHVAMHGGHSDETQVKEYSMAKSLLFIAIGLVLLVAGGRAIVYSAVKMAEGFGISQRIIALTIVSIGTSLPELATSVVAARKKQVDIAIGNVVGSNIFNAFFILGTSATVFPLAVPKMANTDLLVNVLASLLLFVFIFTGKGRRIERWEGVIFVSLYVGYVTFLIMNP